MLFYKVNNTMGDIEKIYSHYLELLEKDFQSSHPAEISNET